MARFEQDLPFQFEEIGIVRIDAEQRVGFGQRGIDQRVLVIGIGAGIARGHVLPALGIFLQRAFGCVEITEQLGLRPHEPFLQGGIGRCVPCRIDDIAFAQRGNTVAR